jgi:hypothetical protein
MKRLFWRIAPEVVLGSFLVATAGGCDPKHDVKPGAPEILGISVLDNITGQSLTISGDAGLVPVPGFVHLSALFDRLLDTGPLGKFDDAGADSGSDVIALTVTPTVSASAMLTYSTIYDPNGGDPEIAPGVPGGLIFGPGPTLNTTASPTFPSNSTITAVLDRTRIRSKKGEPFVGDNQIMFQTQPFAASIAVPMGDPDPDAGADAGTPAVPAAMQAVTITFNNVVGADIITHVIVTAGGTPYTQVDIAPDAANPTVVNVSPATNWPPNTTIAVTVDATADDALGGTTGAAVTESFTTSAAP